MSRVALIVIYNHRYDANIEKLEWLYRGKFSNIYHLVPFYEGNRKNVIPVYEHSFCFQGYVAQGFKSFYREEYDHYFFVADDMVINPLINEQNYRSALQLDDQACFLPGLVPLHQQGRWPHLRSAYNYQIKQPGVHAERELPNADFARERFQKFGIDLQPLTFEQLYGKPAFPKSPKDLRALLSWCLRRLKLGATLPLSYPLVSSYSDIFVVAKATVAAFCRCCGLFAATRLFVEIALPTAMVLTAEKIVSESDLQLKGFPMWTAKDKEILIPYKNRINSLLEAFPQQLLYLHPIKFSQWQLETP